MSDQNIYIFLKTMPTSDSPIWNDVVGCCESSLTFDGAAFATVVKLPVGVTQIPSWVTNDDWVAPTMQDAKNKIIEICDSE